MLPPVGQSVDHLELSAVAELLCECAGHADHRHVAVGGIASLYRHDADARRRIEEDRHCQDLTQLRLVEVAQHVAPEVVLGQHRRHEVDRLHARHQWAISRACHVVWAR